jgi:hypothetical protein
MASRRHLCASCHRDGRVGMCSATHTVQAMDHRHVDVWLLLAAQRSSTWCQQDVCHVGRPLATITASHRRQETLPSILCSLASLTGNSHGVGQAKYSSRPGQGSVLQWGDAAAAAADDIIPITHPAGSPYMEATAGSRQRATGRRWVGQPGRQPVQARPPLVCRLQPIAAMQGGVQRQEAAERPSQHCTSGHAVVAESGTDGGGA